MDATQEATTSDEKPAVDKEAVPSPIDQTEVEKTFKAQIEESKMHRRTFFNTWKRNVELRIGHIATSATGGVGVEDDIQSEINPDWALTKTKTANLYSQVPTVQLTHENKQYAAAIPPFAKALNYELGDKRARVGVAMEEVLNDVVNAAGIGAAIVGYAARFDEVEVPVAETLPGPQGPIPTKSIPPDQLDMIIQNAKAKGIPIPTRMVKRTLDDRFFCTRISPVDLLWPKAFVGSDFDDADWMGYTSRASWAEAINELGKSEERPDGITEDEKDKVLGGEENSMQDDLRSDTRGTGPVESRKVKYDTLYYWRYKVDPDCKSFKSIWRLVFVHGKTKPVIHEQWLGQQYDEQSKKYVGACKFPVRVLTLTYITDNPIPPSDSSAGRPQVEDLRRSRSQMFKNRERSIPIRWADSNRVDPLIMDLLQKGEVQGFVPTNGDGSRSIGEIARASYPSEDMAFDQAAKADLMESWQIGPQQIGSSTPGRKTSAEVQTTQQNFSTRIGQERGRVGTFFTSIAEVMSGWMVLYSDFPSLTDQERQQMQQAWDQKHILHDLVIKIRPDSTIVLDSQARVQRLLQFLNMTAKSGFINPMPVIVEIAELSGLDPNEVVVKPQPKTEDANISYRFSGKDDLINPMVVAILLGKGAPPTPELIEQAKQLLLLAAQEPQPPQPQGQPGMPGQPGQQGPPPPGAHPPSQLPPHPDNIQAHKDWGLPDKVAKRSRDI